MGHTSGSGAIEQNNQKQSAATSFEFIFYSSENNKSKIQRHLALQQHRKRRWQEYGQKCEFDAEYPSPSLTDGTDQSQSSILNIKLWYPPSASKSKAKVSCKSLRSSKRVSNLENIKLGEKLTRNTFNVTQTTSPRSVVDGGRLDPFQIYPIKATPEIHLLVDHYVNGIPATLQNKYALNRQLFQPAKDLFSLYLLHPASFLGLLYHSAYHLASVSGAREMHIKALELKGRALEEINTSNHKCKEKSRSPENGTIIGVFLLSIAERMWGDLDVFRMHWRGMNDMIEARGGVSGFIDDNLVFTKLLWNCFSLLNASDGYFNCALKNIMLPGDYDFRLTGKASKSASDGLQGLITSRRMAVVRVLPTCEAEFERNSERFPMRASAFVEDALLQRTLRPRLANHHCHSSSKESTSGHGGTRTSIQIRGDRRVTDNCRLVCILYLNVVLDELGDLSRSTETFFQGLLNRMAREQCGVDTTPEYLLWCLLRNTSSSSNGDSKRWVKVAHMTAVIKRIPRESLQSLETVLMTFLEMPYDGERLASLPSVEMCSLKQELLSKCASGLNPSSISEPCHSYSDEVDKSSPQNGSNSSSRLDGFSSELCWFINKEKL